MKLTSRFWVWSILVALLTLLVLPDALESLSNHRRHQRIAREKEKVTALVQAGDRGYDELVQILPTLWFYNTPDALKGILAQRQRDRVADLCQAYGACGNNHNTKKAICCALQELGDSRAAPVLQKDLESVWTDLTLIEYDSQIETLGTLRAKDSADLLLRILRHQYSWEGSAWRVKEEVFVALGKIGDQRAMPDAEHYIESDRGGDWYLRQGALSYLIHINNSEAKAAIRKEYERSHEPDDALCLVQVGDMSVVPDVRDRLRKWLDDFGAGGWNHTDYWGIFYYAHALLIAQDADAAPVLRRTLKLFSQPDIEMRRYLDEAARGYTLRVLLDEQSANTLVPDLESFLQKHPAPVQDSGSTNTGDQH